MSVYDKHKKDIPSGNLNKNAWNQQDKQAHVQCSLTKCHVVMYKCKDITCKYMNTFNN